MWIPCETKLPSIGEVVTIWCPAPRPGIGFKWQIAYRRGTEASWWWENHFSTIQPKEVTYWRETPPEPNGG